MHRFLPVFLLAAAAAASVAAADETLPRADAESPRARIHALGRFGANPEGGVSRVAFSDADIAGREYIKSLMRDAGLEVRIDTAGNIIGRRAGTDPSLPVIMTGSHIDSVPKGGNYDGDVGVLGAIEVAELLREHGIATRHPFEFVVFTDEEGGVGRQPGHGRPCRRLGTLDVVSHSGLTIRDGIRAVGRRSRTTGRGAPRTRHRSRPSSSCTSSRARSSTSPASTSASSRASSASAGGTSRSRGRRTTPARRR